MQAQNHPIKNWAKDDKPREKLLSKTPEFLSDSELLAILFGQGTRQKSAVDLAREVLALGKNNLNELGKLSVEELRKIRGIGEARSSVVLAALELGRRRSAAVHIQKPAVKGSRDIAQFLQSRIGELRREVFAVVFLNQANHVIHFEIMSQGGLTSTVVDTRMIMKKALELEAISIILSHNHPSGNVNPSKSDEYLTQKIKDAACYFDIKLIDHIIVSDRGYYSFADQGLL